VIVTVANVAKPVTVDDTAYVQFARHIAQKPTDPYGFTLFWWSEPEPGMQILCPPVLPYWLAVGVRIFGEHIGLLKLWMFPFVLLLAWSLRVLLSRFARGTESRALPLLMLSPAVFPAVNLMLDIPAVAFALTAIVLFLRAADKRTWWLAACAGFVAGVAMQTKYSAFVAPAVIAWYGLVHWRVLLACVACVGCVGVFASWELWLQGKYGVSHFAFHAGASSGGGLRALITAKLDLLFPLAGYLGCLAGGAGLLAASVLRVSRRVVACVAVVWFLGFCAIATFPRRWTMLDANTSVTTLFWNTSGALWCIAVCCACGVLLIRVRKGVSVRFHRDSLFVVGWLAIEVVAAFVLTPFSAARRVIGITLAISIVAARAASRVPRAQKERTPPRWVFALAIVIGTLVTAIDTWDSHAEKTCALQANAAFRDIPPDATVWYVGHWGFQYYCEREGMKPLIAGQSVVREGDFVVLPVYPEDDYFPRPFAGFGVSLPRARTATTVAEFEANDWLSAKTVPNYYGGFDPVTGRDHARLRVRVYRFHRDWIMP
jgi:hypothetical protein